MLMNKTLRAMKVVAPIIVALVVAVAVWRMFFKKEKYSEFQARQWNWTANKYKCARGWKDTGKDKPDDSKGSYLGTSWQGDRSSRHCKKNKYSAFSDVVWNDDKNEFRCPSGYTRNKRESQDSDRACRRKEDDKKYEGGKNEKASTQDWQCTDPEFPARGARPDRLGQCCRAKYSKICAGTPEIDWSDPGVWKRIHEENYKKNAAAAPSPAATTDVTRVYPHWGWGANDGLRCKFGNNTGCTTKWVGGKLVEA
jgi:hypothetical protein